MIENKIFTGNKFKIERKHGHFHACRKVKQSSINKNKSKLTMYNETIPGLADEFRFLFDTYMENSDKSIKRTEEDRPLYISSALYDSFGYDYDMYEYTELAIKRLLNNVRHRIKLFKRKAELNAWNYFVTFTYDSAKHTEESFRKGLLNCLGHLHTRNNWSVMGKFERSPENGRLHFHCLVYVPEGEMVGCFFEGKSYHKKTGVSKTSVINSYFNERFGRCDFEGIDDVVKSVEYISKYIMKDIDEKMYYSRGIPTFIEAELEANEDLSIDYFYFVKKYILNNETFDRSGRNHYFYLGKDMRKWYNKIKLVS